MTADITSWSFLLAMGCAALMGFAIQRGATCTVAAVGEIVDQGSARLLVALAETSLWVAGGLLTARALGLLPALPGGFAVSGWTIAGGALLGLGAYVNRACVFGSIARLGSGQLAYLVSPLGFLLGALGTVALLGVGMPAPLETLPAISTLPLWIAPPFVVYALWRLFAIFRTPHPEGRRWQKAWEPHEATLMIGVTFVIIFTAVGGAWAYTDLLAQVARDRLGSWIWQVLLLLALLAGATTGGWIGNGGLQWRKPALADLARCLIGGGLMGAGSLLIPGSNDGLVLVGLPLLWPYAWVAIASMVVTIWIAFMLGRRLSARANPAAS